MKFDATKFMFAVIAALAVFIAGMYIGSRIGRTTVTIDTTDWEVVRNWEQITQSSEIIARTLQDFKPRPVFIAGDTVWIYDTTQAQNIPMQLYSECHNIPLSVNSDTNYIPVKVEAQYQLIDWIRISTDPMPYPIKIKQKQKAIRFWGYGAAAVNTQKRLQSEIRFGVNFGEHMFIYGGSRVDTHLDATAEVGAGWRL